MVQELIFEEISKDEYSVLESQIKRLPLTQSSIFKCDKYFKIVQDNQTLGLFVLSEHRYIGGLIHGVTLDCGPVWFKGHDTKDNFTAFSETFNETYPKRLGRKRRWIPNQTYTPTTHWKKRGQGHETLWLDLTQPTETLRQNLKKNWRGALKKAEESKLHILWDPELHYLPFILKSYKLDKEQKGYGGLSVSELEDYIRRCHSLQKSVIGRALYNHTTMAYVIIFCHGTSATYQAGWTHKRGREDNAHHLLLWNAIDVLKQKGITDFDLGGINEDTGKGIAQFKMGMGGGLVRGSGLYI